MWWVVSFTPGTTFGEGRQEPQALMPAARLAGIADGDQCGPVRSEHSDVDHGWR